MKTKKEKITALDWCCNKLNENSYKIAFIVFFSGLILVIIPLFLISDLSNLLRGIFKILIDNGFTIMVLGIAMFFFILSIKDRHGKYRWSKE